MRRSFRFHSLLSQFTLRVIAPLMLMMLVMIATGLYVYQQIATSLLIDRDHQLAALSAAQLSTAMSGYARELGTLASSPAIRSNSAPARVAALKSATDLLQIFAAGIVIVDQEGTVLDVAPPEVPPVGQTVAGQDYFKAVRERLTPAFSNVSVNARTGQIMVVIAVPILDETKTFAGAVLGVVDLGNTALSQPIEELSIGDSGIAYVVDRNGRVIFHPDAATIGIDYSDRPFVRNVIAGESGGALWHDRTSEQVVVGYAPVAHTNWGVIVREPWESVVGPIQVYGVILGLATLAVVGVTAYLLWQGVRRIAIPVRLLVEQTVQLATGETVEPIASYGIREIDALEQAFSQMATQIASYRAGLRRYVEAITQSQEDERRRIARELHDETIQSLLTIARRLELYQATENDPTRLARLAEVQAMVTDTVQGVRQISRDLRPLILEDLGLIPALQTLVRAAREGQGALPHAKFEVRGQPVCLRGEQEIALYRITQEALTNVRKHARAKEARVYLSFNSTQVELEVSDDGQGFTVPFSLTELAQRDSFGLMGIQERVWAVGGSLSIRSTPNQGTQLIVAIPVESHPV